MQFFVKLQAKCMQRVTLKLPLQCSDFNNELKILYARMATHVVLVFKPSFEFAIHFNQNKVHNMMAIMLVPRFKRLLCLTKYIGQKQQLILLMSMTTKF
jgi:hypothetical protein